MRQRMSTWSVNFPTQSHLTPWTVTDTFSGSFTPEWTRRYPLVGRRCGCKICTIPITFSWPGVQGDGDLFTRSSVAWWFMSTHFVGFSGEPSQWSLAKTRLSGRLRASLSSWSKRQKINHCEPKLYSQVPIGTICCASVGSPPNWLLFCIFSTRFWQALLPTLESSEDFDKIIISVELWLLSLSCQSRSWTIFCPLLWLNETRVKLYPWHCEAGQWIWPSMVKSLASFAVCLSWLHHFAVSFVPQRPGTASWAWTRSVLLFDCDEKFTQSRKLVRKSHWQCQDRQPLARPTKLWFSFGFGMSACRWRFCPAVVVFAIRISEVCWKISRFLFPGPSSTYSPDGGMGWNDQRMHMGQGEHPPYPPMYNYPCY